MIAPRRQRIGDAKRVAFLAILAMTTQIVWAATPSFPVKPVRMIISNTVGSAPDTVARLLTVKLTENWGQQIVVDNRAGAAGLLAAEYVAKAAPDGYTLWVATLTQLLSMSMHQRFNMARDFIPVSYLASTPFVISVSASIPVTTTAEFIAHAKARGGKLLYGSSGQWGSSHLCMEQFRAMTGIDMVHVPYKGTSPVFTDLMGGQVHATCAAAPAYTGAAQSGKLRMLGVTTRARTRLVPGVPTIAEAVSGFEFPGWYGLFLPLGTPRDLVRRINADVLSVLKSPDIQERLIAVGAEAVGSSPEAFTAFLRADAARFEKLLHAAGWDPSKKAAE